MKKMIKKGASVGAMLLLAVASFGQLTPSNPETLVNTTTTAAQQNPAISMDTLGNYVVVWESENQDGDGFGIYAKVYNADHSVRVSDFLVNTSEQLGEQRFPDVAMNADGTFCVVWQTNEDESSQGWDVYRRIYDVDGTAITSRSRIHTSSSGNQMHPAVAANDEYFYVICMSEQVGSNESTIEGRFYLANGAATSSSYDIGISAGNHQGHADVGLDQNNNAIIVWQSDGVDGDRQGVYASSYSESNTLNFGPIQINTETAGNQQAPSIAVDENGNAMIVWSSYDQDGDQYGVYGQFIDNAGAMVGSELSVSTTTNGSQDFASVAASRSGDKFVVTWTDDSEDGDFQGVYARAHELGAFTSTETLINTRTTDRQMFSDVAIGLDTTDAVFAWQGGLRKETTSGDDTDDYGVYISSALVADTTPPVADCQNATVYLDGSGNVTITAADVDGGSTDNVGIVSSTISDNSFTCANTGINVVTLTVTDAAGLTDACNAAVFVVDSTAPTVICQDLTVYLDGSGNATITTGDVDNGSTDNCSIASLSLSQTSFTCANVGTNTVTLSATDSEGNVGGCNATVTVIDSVTPTALCNGLTVYLDGSGSTTITTGDIDNGSVDNCSISSYSISASTFTCADIGANTVTLTVTDIASNTATCDATVTVIDSVQPVVACQDLTVYLDGSGLATITAADVDAGTSDNCSTPSLAIDVSTFSCVNIGANTVMLTATDDYGNTSNCSATVTIADTTSPVAACTDITTYLDGAGNVSITAGDVDNGSIDNCGVSSLSLSTSAFTCANIGANTVNLTVSDAQGNADVCAATITVIDSVMPTALCNGLTVHLDGAGSATITTET